MVVWILIGLGALCVCGCCCYCLCAACILSALGISAGSTEVITEIHEEDDHYHEGGNLVDNEEYY